MALTHKQLAELRETSAEAGNRVAKAIELSGLTKVDVAKGTGLPYTYVTDVAAVRNHTITVEKAHVFAEFFGCPIEDLFPAREAA